MPTIMAATRPRKRARKSRQESGHPGRRRRPNGIGVAIFVAVTLAILGVTAAGIYRDMSITGHAKVPLGVVVLEIVLAVIAAWQVAVWWRARKGS